MYSKSVIRGGEDFVRGLFRHPLKSQGSNGLTHTLTCKPMLQSEFEKFESNCH